MTFLSSYLKRHRFVETNANFPHNKNCSNDGFWFNSEEKRSCGCRGNGCNDVLYEYAPHTVHYYYYPYVEDYLEADRLNNHEEHNLNDRIFSGNNFIFNFESDTTYSHGDLLIEWTCTKFMNDPIIRLHELVNQAYSIIEDLFGSDWRTAVWKKKFDKNSKKIEKSFKRMKKTNENK